MTEHTFVKVDLLNGKKTVPLVIYNQEIIWSATKKEVIQKRLTLDEIIDVLNKQITTIRELNMKLNNIREILCDDCYD